MSSIARERGARAKAPDPGAAAVRRRVCQVSEIPAALMLIANDEIDKTE